MKIKLKVSLLLIVVSVLQTGCGLVGDNCADSIKMTGVDETSGVRFDVEGVNGHHTESGFSQCSFDITNIKLTKAGKIHEYSNRSVMLSEPESVEIKDLFPQLSDVQFQPLFIWIDASIVDTSGNVSVMSSPNGFSYSAGDPAVFVDLTVAH